MMLSRSTSRLAQVSAWVESTDRADAVRFEPGVYAKVCDATLGVPYVRAVQNAMAAHHCSLDTARVICASSYGLYQIMAYHLYSDWCPWSRSVFEFVSDREGQTQVYLALLAHMNLPQTFDLVFASDSSLLNFATHYNGPGAPDVYAHSMREAARSLHLI